MFSQWIQNALIIFIASSFAVTASIPTAYREIQNSTATSINATTSCNDTADISQPTGIKCVVSRGPCEVAANCKYDIHICPPAQEGTQNVCMAAGQWLQNGTLVALVRGCFTGTSPMTHCMSDHCDIQPRGNSSFICCCQSDYCNLPPIGWNETIHSVTKERIPTKPPTLGEVLAVVFCLLIVTCLSLCIFIARHLNKPPMPLPDTNQDNYGLSDHPSTDQQLLISTHPLQGHIQLGEPIKNGEGRFGRVHLGRHMPIALDGTCIIVAIKVFDSSKSQSWLVERAFYTSTKMSSSHENILRFYGDTVVEDEGGEVTQLWLTTEYHRRGSLNSYLTQELLTLCELLRMCEGLADAVEFLHSERPYAVAHRDIKSQNVLVKDDLSICLADFGLALSFNKRVAEKDRTQKGTRLYMAPEILQGAIDNFVEENYCPVDVYAMALVLWELLSRCSCTTGSVGPYKLPYTAELGDHPDGEKVKDHVATNLQRPHFQGQWIQHPVLGILCETIDDCWKSEPMVRIKAATVPYRLAAMREVQKKMTRSLLDGSEVSSTSSHSSGISESASGGASDVTLEIETNCDGAPGRISHSRHHYDGSHCNQDSGIMRDCTGVTLIDMDCNSVAETKMDSNGGTGFKIDSNGMTQIENDYVVPDCTETPQRELHCNGIPHSKGDCKKGSQIIMDCSEITQCQMDCRGQPERDIVLTAVSDIEGTDRLWGMDLRRLFGYNKVSAEDRSTTDASETRM